MAKKANRTDQQADTLFGPATHIRSLIEWMSQGMYEKEHIIAAALLCAVAGENIFLLGPPGTAKSMVASRLKMIFRDGKSFDYLMSRFSTHGNQPDACVQTLYFPTPSIARNCMPMPMHPA